MVFDIKAWLAKQKKERPICYFVGRTFAIIISVICIVELLITLSDVVAAEISRKIHPSNTTFLDVSSSIILATATTVYVILTYSIARSTKNSILQSEKTNLQSEKMMEQTANSEKIRLNERKLELFYLPMQNLLKKFDINRIVELNQKVKSGETSLEAKLLDIYQIWQKFRKDYDKIVPFTYLASEDVLKSMADFTNIFESNRLFTEKSYDLSMGKRQGEQNPEYEMKAPIATGYDRIYVEATARISEHYDAVLNKIDSEIKLLGKELTKLVDQ